MRTTETRLLLLGVVVGLPMMACAAEDATDFPSAVTDEISSLDLAGPQILGSEKGGGSSIQSQCGATRDLQYVESYDGSAGVSASFVAYHETRVGQHVRGPCSGTLISDDLFLSAGNCGYAVGDQVRFDYQLTPDGWYRSPRDFYVTQIVEQQNDASWDYAIVRLGGSPGREFGHANLTAAPPASSTVAIISHPHQLKEVQAGPTVAVVPSRGDNWFSYFVDVESGSRGAGILDAQGRLVGVHTNSNCFVGTPLSGNEGMRMSRLIPHSPTLSTLTQNKILWRYLNTASVSLWSVDASGARIGDVGHNAGGAWVPLTYSNNQITWRNSNSDFSVWTLNNFGSLLSVVTTPAPYRWRPVSAANGRVLWQHNVTGGVRLWKVDAAGNHLSYVEHPVASGWTPINYANNHILWKHTSGVFSLWRLDDDGNFLSTSPAFHNGVGWDPISYENGQLLWKNVNGAFGVWTLNRNSVKLDEWYSGANPDWTPMMMSDRQLAWRHTSGLFSLWQVTDLGIYLGSFGHNVGLDWRPVAVAGARP